MWHDRLLKRREEGIELVYKFDPLIRNGINSSASRTEACLKLNFLTSVANLPFHITSISLFLNFHSRFLLSESKWDDFNS